METARIYVQSNQELDEIWAQLQQRLAPARVSATSNNASLYANYLVKRFRRPDGLTDGSVDNFYRATNALQNALDWDIQPKPKAPAKPQADAQGLTRLKSQSEQLRSQNAEAEKAAATRASSEAQQAEHTRVLELLNLAEELLTSNRTRRRTHSRTQRLRESLRETLARERKPRMTVSQAEELYTKLLAQADAFPD